MNRPSPFFHEQLYRSEAGMRKLRDTPVTICGAGALGANITEGLARQGFGRLTIIDRDRVEERNLSTQPYFRTDIGSQKAKILANSLYRALGTAVQGRVEDLSAATTGKLLSGSTLVVETFDNSTSRQAVKDWCAEAGVPCLHVGLAGDYAEVIWNENYRVPSAVNDDVCDYPLARNLVLLAVAVACETIVEFISTGEKRSHTITLGDFAVRPFLFTDQC